MLLCLVYKSVLSYNQLVLCLSLHMILVSLYHEHRVKKLGHHETSVTHYHPGAWQTPDPWTKGRWEVGGESTL